MLISELEMSPSLSRLPLLAAVLLASAACSDDPPEEALFEGEHDPPTPNKLRGLYKTVVEVSDMSTEVRLEFTDGALIGAVKCSPKSPALQPVSVGGQIPFQTDALDAADGQFTIDALNMEKSVNQTTCQGGLREGTYKFKLEEFRLTLSLSSVPSDIIYTKIGDSNE